MSGAALRLEGASFRYGGDGFALEGLDLAIEPGELVACVGPSGSGKTTLLHLCAGILPADSGRVAFDGEDWRALGETERRRRRIARIGLVFQELELLEYLSVRENVLLPYLVGDALHPGPEVAGRVAALAGATGIGALVGRLPAALSQGERQRVALCRALVTEPPLVLADEPTGNLDPETSRRVLALLLEQVRARGATLVMVTHDHGLLGEFDRVLDLADSAGTAGTAGAAGARA